MGVSPSPIVLGGETSARAEALREQPPHRLVADLDLYVKVTSNRGRCHRESPGFLEGLSAKPLGGPAGEECQLSTRFIVYYGGRSGANGLMPRDPIIVLRLGRKDPCLSQEWKGHDPCELLGREYDMPRNTGRSGL